jgi:GNAT superfamily N-acetyltransferase
MSDPLARYCLRPTRTPQDWAAYHAIRRDAIFALLLPGQAYDANDADEFKPGNLPHVLVHDGEVIGTVRIDLIDAIRAGLRLIGIRRDRQRQGHGVVLLSLAEQTVRGLGRSEVVVNAARSALAFYLANGYGEGDWRDQGPAPAGNRPGRETLATARSALREISRAPQKSQRGYRVRAPGYLSLMGCGAIAAMRFNGTVSLQSQARLITPRAVD